MKNFLILLIIVFAVYKGWTHYQLKEGVEPLYDEPYVAVYGRDTCGFTRHTKKELSSIGIKYKYFIIDEK